ncbi:MAG: tetratricopeptide repeat protein [Candidatus Omnitrophica bacterium]|nr:tetratricopeptide repeat protein [Candidatus Omnitrophota bacterium]
MALIIIMGFAVYSNSFNSNFFWDDGLLIKNNEYIRSWTNLAHLFTKDIGSGGGTGKTYTSYRPLQMVTYMVDYSLWTLNPKGYHLTNILLHISAALGVYWLINMIFRENWLSLLTGLLFVVHPIHTEAVTYISGRADPLALLFMLLCFIFYIKSYGSKGMGAPILMLLSYAFALLSRENSLILPVLLLLYHYSFKKKVRIEKFLPVAGLAAVYIVLRATVLKALLAADVAHTTTLFQRLPGFFVAVATYSKLLFLPFDLHMEYGLKLFPWGNFKAILGIIIVCAVLIYVFRRKNNDQLVFFSILWFFITLLPVSNLYPINAYMAEHWLYLPSIGFFLIMAKAISIGATLPRRQAGGRLPLLKILTIIFAICLLAFYSCLTVKQNVLWRDPLSFFERTLKYSPDNARVHYNLSNAYKTKNRLGNAIAGYQKAVEIDPDYAEAHNNLGAVYAAINKNEEAVASYRRAVTIDAGFAEAHNNLGAVYAAMHKNEEAIASYKKAIGIDGDFAGAYINLGVIYRSMNNNDDAIAYYRKALEIDPGHAEAYFNLGNIYAPLNRTAEAVDAYRKAIEHKADFAKAYLNLGNVYKASGHMDSARSSYKRAIDIDPNYALAHNYLAIIYFQEKDYPLAVMHCEKAKELGSTNSALLEALKPYR